jgi:hypothetical protein
MANVNDESDTAFEMADDEPDTASEMADDDSHTTSEMDDDDSELECHCGAASCRQTITGQDWRRKDLQDKYKGYLSAYLSEKIKRLTDS